MRRALISADFGSCLAGDVGCWRFSVAPPFPLPKGTIVRFDMGSLGTNHEWQIPQTNPQKENAIFGLFAGNTVVKAKEVILENGSSVFEFVLPKVLAITQRFQIILGGTPDSCDTKKGTNRVQTYIQRRRPFIISIEHSTSNIKEQERAYIDIRGNLLANIRILTPSCVGKGKRFDAVVRFEDTFGNLTNNAPADTLISLTHEHLRENLQWKLFVHETGFVTLPNLYFNEIGVYRIRLTDEVTQKTFYSAPIRCLQDEVPLFWGLFRGGTPKPRALEPCEISLRQFRDDLGLNFCAVLSTNGAPEQTRAVQQALEEFNEDDRFTTFFSALCTGKSKETGCRQFVACQENRLPPKLSEIKTSGDLKKVYKHCVAGEIFAYSFLTNGEKIGYDFQDLSSDKEPLVEIYCSLGSSECADENLFPITSSAKGIKSASHGFIRDALQQNLRFGFCAGGLHIPTEEEQKTYSPGMTAIYSSDFSRKSIFDAVLKRHCFATTGPRIVIGFFIAGSCMGSELSTANKPGLVFNRHISGYVSGETPLQRVELIRNGKVLHAWEVSGRSPDLNFTHDDQENLADIAIQKDEAIFCYYYLRVIQVDTHAAWTSPIWVDLITTEKEPDALPCLKDTKPDRNITKKTRSTYPANNSQDIES